jgi:Sulfotransferase domain
LVLPSTNSLQKGIWIASYPGSGNTWARAFVHNLLREIRGNVVDAQDINRLRKHTVWENDAVPYEQLLGKSLTKCSREEIARTRPQVQQLLSEARTRPFFVKTHLAVARVEGFPTINFEMTLAAIYIIRNPLDVAISCSHHSGREIAPVIEHMADPIFASRGSERFVYEFMGSWSAHVASWLSVSHRPVYVMRYEDMLKDPLRAFGALARFLRLDLTPAQLQRAIDKSSFSELSKQEREKGFAEKPATTEKFFRAGCADQWRDVLTKAQVGRIVEAHAPMMMRTGYLLPNCGADVPPPSRSKMQDTKQHAYREPNP